MVRVIVYTKKISRSDGSNIGILQNGATSQNFGSAPETWLEPYNTDAFNILYTKQYVMCPQRRGTGAVAPNQWAEDAQIGGVQSFVMKKAFIKLPASLLYDESIADKPTNASAWMSVCVCNINGDLGTSPTLAARCMINADAFLSYTDA